MIDKHGMRYLNEGWLSARTHSDDTVSIAGTNFSDTLSIADTHVSLDEHDLSSRSSRAGGKRPQLLLSSKCHPRSCLGPTMFAVPRVLSSVQSFTFKESAIRMEMTTNRFCLRAEKTLMDHNHHQRDWVRNALPSSKNLQVSGRHEWSHSRTAQDDLGIICYGSEAGSLSSKNLYTPLTGKDEESSQRTAAHPLNLMAHVDSS